MSRELTPGVTLESLRKEAKRWLKAIRGGDVAAAARLRRVYGAAPPTPGLRDIQHALALEHGCVNWQSLKARVVTVPPSGRSLSRDGAIKALLDAAIRGDASQVGRLLETYPDIANERGLLPGHHGMRTALHHAAGNGHDAVVKLLLDRGADPNIRCEGDWAFPLHFAAEQAHMGIVRLLIEHGADPIGEGDYHDLEVIGWATCFSYRPPNTALVEYLLAHGARHTIFSTVATGEVKGIRRLIAQSPADLERRMDTTNRRRRPLHLAVVKNQPEALTALLDLGAAMDSLDEAGLTALDQAALSGEIEMAQRLLGRGAEIGLPAAVVLQRTGDIERLMRKDPDGLKPGHRWGTLIVRASEWSTGSVIETLIRLGASVDVWDEPNTAVDGATRFTPLHAAATCGNLEAAAILLKHGANPATREGRYCGTPAGWANHFGRQQVRDLLLKEPIDIFEAIDFDLTDRIPEVLESDPHALNRPFGVVGQPRSAQWWPEPWCTPLMWSVRKDRIDATRVLLQHGADASVQAPDGRVLLDLAGTDHREQVANLLRAGF